MLFAKAVFALCAAAVVAASSCGGQDSFNGRWGGGEDEGLRCRCNSKSSIEDDGWTKNACQVLGKSVKVCRGHEEFYCKAGKHESMFRDACEQRGRDCRVDNC
ncbi:hypothetical protein EDD11_004400 [Mortierella claussenii]|nr:hypothetical protein EDD11_004400 [Mortierella claussenii]